MIVFFPLAPVIIGIVVLGLSLTDGLVGMIDGITTFLLVAMVIIAIAIFISNLNASKKRAIETKEFVLNTIAGVVSIIASYVFFGFLCGTGSDISGLFDFLIIAVFLGPIWLCMVGHWWGTCAESDSESVKCFIYTMICAAVMFFVATL